MQFPSPPHLPNQKEDAYAYIQISMGMIHPDYVYINHFLHEPDEETSNPLIVQTADHLEVSNYKEKTIESGAMSVMRIHLHSRKDTR